MLPDSRGTSLLSFQAHDCEETIEGGTETRGLSGAISAPDFGQHRLEVGGWRFVLRCDADGFELLGYASEQYLVDHATSLTDLSPARAAAGAIELRSIGQPRAAVPT